MDHFRTSAQRENPIPHLPPIIHIPPASVARTYSPYWVCLIVMGSWLAGGQTCAHLGPEWTTRATVIVLNIVLGFILLTIFINWWRNLVLIENEPTKDNVTLSDQV